MTNDLSPFGRRWSGLLILSIAVLLSACATQPDSTPPLSAVTAMAQPPSQREDDAGANTCREIARDLSHHDSAALNGKLDLRLILQQVFSALDSQLLDATQRQKLVAQLEEQIKSKLVENYGEDNWDMLRGYADGDRYLCLLRTDMSNQGVSYVEFDLRMVDGRMQIVDWIDLVQEQRVSEMFRELFGDIATMLESSTKPATHYWELFTPQERLDFFEFLKTVRDQDSSRIFTAYDRLSWRFKQKPLYALLVVKAASAHGDGLYQKALKNFEQRFGGEDHYGILLIDLYVEERRYEQAILGLKRFRDKVGADPVIDILLAIIEREQGHSASFYEHCLQAINVNPNYVQTYWLLLDQLVADRHYDDAVLVLNVLTSMFNFALSEHHFEADEKYQAFRKSEAFRAWALDRA